MRWFSAVRPRPTTSSLLLVAALLAAGPHARAQGAAAKSAGSAPKGTSAAKSAAANSAPPPSQNFGPVPEAGPVLEGRVQGNVYFSPTGAFKIKIPVLPELGGDITDTPQVVTFEDDFNVYVSIAAFAHDATQRWEFSTRGAKDYLIYFFRDFVLPDFRQSFEGVRMEDSSKFIPTLNDGALLTFLLIPGASMFADRVPSFGAIRRIAVAKRANLLFVRNGYTFVVSYELAERVTEGRAWGKNKDEENEILWQRLRDILNRMQFTGPAAAPAPAPAKK